MTHATALLFALSLAPASPSPLNSLRSAKATACALPLKEGERQERGFLRNYREERANGITTKEAARSLPLLVGGGQGGGSGTLAKNKPPQNSANENLAQLEASHQYFELRDAILKRKGNDADTLFYRGLTRSRFGDRKGAEQDLQAFLFKFPEDKKRVGKARLVLADIHVNQGLYKEAARDLDAALTSDLDPKQKENALNERTLWSSVADVPPQSVAISQASTLKMRRTIGLRIPVTVGEKEVEFIFDTGANLTCLSATMAAQLGVRARPEVIQVEAISGTKVPAQMAEIPELKVGNATVRHALALVFADKDVTIPNTTFRLDAILGYPVISGLRQFSITRAGDLEIPARPGPRKGADMCLEGLTPLVQATAFGKLGTYSFDTGADRTDFWPSFFRDHETEIRAKGSEGKEGITGVGGTRPVPAWRLPSLTLTLAGREVRLNSPKILTEVTSDRSRYHQGNLGQDLIHQFDRVTLNFERMTLALE